MIYYVHYTVEIQHKYHHFYFRISQLEFLSDSEVKTLKQLQKMYHVESRPPKLINHTPQTKGPELLTDVGGLIVVCVRLILTFSL